MSLDQLLADQRSIATRRQLGAWGMTPDEMRARVDAGRWRSLNESVICCHNGPMAAKQAWWAVVLSAPGLVALSGLTAMAELGIKGFETAEVHVLVPRGARVVPVPGVVSVVHESRRFAAIDVLPRLLPTTTIERAVIDAAVWSGDLTTAARLVVAAVQQRRTTADRLREALVDAGQVRFRRPLLAFIGDLKGGAEALSEVEFRRWCRRHHFPTPLMNVRHDSRGRRRYLDAAFCRHDGSRVLVEVDGGIHLTLTARWRDTAKDNDAVIEGWLTLRFPSIAIYSNDPVAVRQLRTALGES